MKDYSMLIESAVKAKEKAYAPYSNFKVGAALLGESGRIYTGCNVENASYGLTICAERTACVKGVSSGETKFTHLAVAADLENMTAPCGACRQFLLEFNPKMRILLIGVDEYIEIELKELLPRAFGPEHL